jgi:hypothetical protein
MSKKNKQKQGGASRDNRRSLVLTVKELIQDYIYRIDLDADYQREKVWSKKNQEELLDSILRDIDIPKLYLAEVTDNKQFDYECIDGKQRMLTLMSFLKPEESEESPLLVDVFNNKYTYKELKKEHPNIAKKIENYKLNFIVYNQASLDETFVREIFRRLQLGIRLNSGELLNSQTGTLRDFVFKEIGKDGPFFRNTNLSDKRYSRQFTLAQICINSFNRKETGDFGRARLTDIQYFFEDKAKLEKDDENLNRIRAVLKIMDKGFANDAQIISSRATAVSAYLFVENLYLNGEEALVPEFVKFYIELLNQVKRNMELLSQYEKPENPKIMEEFQKYILQASVEPYSIRRRNEFLEKAFIYYRDPAKKRSFVGSK